MPDPNEIRDAVRERYGRIALTVLQPEVAEGRDSCCGGECCGGAGDPISGSLYRPEEVAALPADAVLASLGCGNPTALAELAPGETVLDLGSGGGIDVLLSARRVGPSGKAYGLDMTDEMLALARQNATRAGADNVEFLKGRIEEIPLPDDSVDVVISNCVINLSTDKCQVLREAFRVLKPGGRLAVSDVVVDGPVPESLRHQIAAWVGCVAGALDRDDYLARLASAGFVDASIEPTRYYNVGELDDAQLKTWLATRPADEWARLSHAFFGAFVRAKKPAFT
ncbi:MAG: arsenite methyltransferase [Chloroflexota bacterium]